MRYVIVETWIAGETKRGLPIHKARKWHNEEYACEYQAICRYRELNAIFEGRTFGYYVEA